MDLSAPDGAQGRTMMEKKLRLYLWWKGRLSARTLAGKGPNKGFGGWSGDGDRISEALKRKDQVMRERGQSRRRVRGGAPASGSSSGAKKDQKDAIIGESEMRDEADRVAQLYVLFLTLHFYGPHPVFILFLPINSLATQKTTTNNLLFNPDIIETDLDDAALLDITSLDFESEFDTHYGLLTPEQTVVVRAYSDDSDDQVLAEIQPKYIVMFEPNQDFVRRIEASFPCIYWLDFC